MAQSVELVLDDGLDAAVRGQWAALADAGLPSLASHTGPTNRPHVTLVAAGAVPDPVGAALTEAVDGLPLPVDLGAVALFGDGRHRVLVRLVVPSAALLALHDRVAGACGSCPGLSATARVGAWTPHVTLARRIGVERLAEALGVLDGHGPTVTRGLATAARRWDSGTRRAWDLGG